MRSGGFRCCGIYGQPPSSARSTKWRVRTLNWACSLKQNALAWRLIHMATTSPLRPRFNLGSGVWSIIVAVLLVLLAAMALSF